MDAAILRIEGTNCEDESLLAFQEVGVTAEHVHLKQLLGECPPGQKRRLSDYKILFLPGGWSAGDYVRAGAIFAARMKAHLAGELAEFVEEGRMVMGVCNGFQVLTELGLLPAFDGPSDTPQASLTTNANARFECRPAYLLHERKTPFTSLIKDNAVLQIPVAHAEGRLTFGEEGDESLARLIENDQVVFRYCRPGGAAADGQYPWNPNGSVSDIAGICNPAGNVLGMMPHPERVTKAHQQADWTRKTYEQGDGLQFFKSIAENLGLR